MLKRLPLLSALLLIVFLSGVLVWGFRRSEEIRVLRAVVERLSADSRVAEVYVTESTAEQTTIKFLEYDAKGKPMSPRYFSFTGNLIQFQTLVVRFDDSFVKKGDPLRGKSAYLFLRAFFLDEGGTEIYNLAEVNEIPGGYKVPGVTSGFEKKLWEQFWTYALDPSAKEPLGIKNAQIEAPGTRFVPGAIYTVRIEHDGGIRIDPRPIPEILKGESF